MATLRELLDTHLPAVLSPDVAKAQKGTAIIEALIKVDPVFKEYSPNVLRQYFSAMSKDASSCIARVATGYGYYLRTASPVATSEVPAVGDVPGGAEPPHGRKHQPEEKFRAIYERWIETYVPASAAMTIEHTKGVKGASGENYWKYPDVVVVTWLVLPVDDPTDEFDPYAVELRRSLGDPLFRMTSIELKVRATISDARAMFFQCLSNSRWAHRASLALAESITDESVASELRRLGQSYGIEVVSFGLPLGAMDHMPDADTIRAMDAEKFAKDIGDTLEVAPLTSGNDRSELDWSYLADIRPRNPDFNHLLEWVSFCIKNGRSYAYSAYEKMHDI